MRALIKFVAVIAALCVGITVAGALIAVVGSVLDAPNLRNNGFIKNLAPLFMAGVAAPLGIGVGIAVYRFVKRRLGHAR